MAPFAPIPSCQQEVGRTRGLAGIGPGDDDQAGNGLANVLEADSPDCGAALGWAHDYSLLLLQAWKGTGTNSASSIGSTSRSSTITIFSTRSAPVGSR